MPGLNCGTELNDSLLQYSCLENSVGRGAWWATVCGPAKSGTCLSTYPSLQKQEPEWYGVILGAQASNSHQYDDYFNILTAHVVV